MLHAPSFSLSMSCCFGWIGFLGLLCLPCFQGLSFVAPRGILEGRLEIAIVWLVIVECKIKGDFLSSVLRSCSPKCRRMWALYVPRVLHLLGKCRYMDLFWVSIKGFARIGWSVCLFGPYHCCNRRYVPSINNSLIWYLIIIRWRELIF